MLRNGKHPARCPHDCARCRALEEEAVAPALDLNPATLAARLGEERSFERAPVDALTESVEGARHRAAKERHEHRRSEERGW